MTRKKDVVQSGQQAEASVRTLRVNRVPGTADPETTRLAVQYDVHETFRRGVAAMLNSICDCRIDLPCMYRVLTTSCEHHHLFTTLLNKDPTRNEQPFAFQNACPHASSRKVEEIFECEDENHVIILAILVVRSGGWVDRRWDGLFEHQEEVGQLGRRARRRGRWLKTVVCLERGRQQQQQQQQQYCGRLD